MQIDKVIQLLTEIRKKHGNIFVFGNQQDNTGNIWAILYNEEWNEAELFID
jgi:hypothetical protein